MKLPINTDNQRPPDWKAKSRALIFNREMSNFTKSFRDNFVTLMVSSFGLLVALSWNKFWEAWVATLTPEKTLYYNGVVALTMTILAVVATYFLSKLKNSR
ncbi:MAG: DUF5654 family protein [Candidatus Aenigmarchaeota archaeon]|nr:DUF5654 family protein [Candidatus Aenigmarchaeota archaeon]